MNLEKIVINGFKSFADKTELQFNQPITAIVGPNGCGKSNVVDAIKWVLGNQSPKSLRSGQMTDVIFSGSSTRKPNGMAEVSLYFSQVQGQTLIAEQDELVISRRLYRSGESEYLINGKPCRLRDIRDLFLDTGVGVSAYSIIEQGQIDQLLHASKIDRRVIFEEAAGISRFKVHKKEAQRKLERTEQNLLRLADIVNEVQRQLRSIKLQAGKARNYLEYTRQLKELRVSFSLSEYHKLSGRQKERQQTLGSWQEKFAQTAALVSRCDAQAGQLTSDLQETETQISRWDNALIAARSRIEQQIERIRFLKDRTFELQERQQTAAGQVRNLNEQSGQFIQELADQQQQLQISQQQIEKTNIALQQQETEIRTISGRCADLQAQLEDEKSGILDIVRRTAQLHNEIQSLSAYRNNLSGQKTRLTGKASQTQEQLAQWLTEKAQHQARLEDIQGILTELDQTLAAQKEQMDILDRQESALRQELDRLKERRSGLTGELNVLREMESRRHGLSDTVKMILQERNEQSAQRDYIDGVLADILHAPVEYAPAVEAALGSSLQALLVNSARRFLADQTLEEKISGRLQAIFLDRIEPFCDRTDLRAMPGVLGRLIEFVRYEDRYAPLCWMLLGNVLLVESIEVALQLSRQLDSAYRFVTPQGRLLQDKWTLQTGPMSQSAGLLSRKSRILQLDDMLASLQRQIEQQEQLIQQTDQKAEHISKLCQDLRTSIYEANTERVDSQSRLRLVEQNIKRLADEQPIIAEEIRALEDQIQQSVRREHESKRNLDELEQVNQQRSLRIEELQNRLLEQKNMLQARSSERTETRIQQGQIVEQQKAVRQRIASLQSQLQHSRMALEAARSEARNCREQIEQTERNILSVESQINQLYLEKENAQKNSRLLHEQADSLLNRRKQNDQQLRQARLQQQEIEQQIHQIQLDLGQVQVRLEDLVQRVQEELQMNLTAEYEHFEDKEVDWQAVQDQIADLRARIERLGHVNVEAIEQQDELEKRSAFLTSQVDDLQKSKAQLEQLIERINKESREIFAVTFEQVRIHFQEIFRKLFGGGKADILLENPEDLLESGIEIVARPPGKETRTISLLSGGEKSMSAIALLFAVFRSKPSPFCVLDEVDAALDEANNERFNLIVQEFKKSSQFIVITHSKRTMSIADILYGITMQTQGVSKKISVQFDSARPPVDAAVA